MVHRYFGLILYRLSTFKVQILVGHKAAWGLLFLVFIGLVNIISREYLRDESLMCLATDQDVFDEQVHETVAASMYHSWDGVFTSSTWPTQTKHPNTHIVRREDSLSQSGAHLYCYGMCANANVCNDRFQAKKIKQEFDQLAFGRVIQQASLSGEFVGLAVGVVRKGEIVFEHAFGKTDTSTSAKSITPTTVFGIASVSKSFAAAAVALMVQDRRMKYEEPISKYIPGFALRAERKPNTATLEFALSHQLGLPYHAMDLQLERGGSFMSLVTKLRHLRARCAVGTCYAYQNIGFNVVEPSIEKVSELSYAEFLKHRIFEPLGMQNASVGLAGLRKSKRWARPHTRSYDKGGWRELEPGKKFYELQAASGVNASLRDMLQWLRAMTGYAPHVFNPKVLEDMFEERVETRYETWRSRIDWKNRLTKSYYGLGWRKYEYAGSTFYGHSGAIRGYRSQVVFLLS